MALLAPLRPEASQVRHVVIAYHPGRYAQVVDSVCAELVEAGLGVSRVPTESDTGQTAEALAATIRTAPVNSPKEIGIGVVAGDGTQAKIIKASRFACVATLTNGETPITSIAGGFAGDHRRSCHGDLGRTASEIILQGVVVPAHWIIRTRIAPDSNPVLDEAYMYTGIGKTAEGARRTNCVDEKEGRLHRLARLGFGTLFTPIEFSADIGNGAEKFSDITVAVISRMSVVGFTNTEPWSGDMRVITTSPGHVANIRSALALMLPAFPAGVSAQKFSVRVLEDTLWHRDGEPPDVLSEGTELSYEASGDTYPTLTTRFAPKATHFVQSASSFLNNAGSKLTANRHRQLR